MLRSFHQRGETPKEDDNRQHRTKGRESTHDGHDGRSLIRSTGVGGCSVGPGTDATLRQLRRRPQEPREPLPPEVIGRRPERPFSLDYHLFIQSVRSARRGAAAVPSGVTAEHLKPILDSARDAELLCQAAELMARASIPEDVLQAIRMGRMTALQKPTGGVRGIVAGDTIRELVSRTMAQQIRKKVEKATAPFQYALSTRAGCECIAHAIQATTDANPHCTVLSMDGIGAYDTISRRAGRCSYARSVCFEPA